MKVSSTEGGPAAAASVPGVNEKLLRSEKGKTQSGVTGAARYEKKTGTTREVMLGGREGREVAGEPGCDGSQRGHPK